jgi:hypothetical protein
VVRKPGDVKERIAIGRELAIKLPRVRGACYTRTTGLSEFGSRETIKLKWEVAEIVYVLLSTGIKLCGQVTSQHSAYMY